jgi:hypothetical protein
MPGGKRDTNVTHNVVRVVVREMVHLVTLEGIISPVATEDRKV